MKISYLVPLVSEAERYRPKSLKGALEPMQYNESILGIRKIKNTFKQDKKILLNGNRVIDQQMVELSAKYGKDINIIQHGRHLFNSNPVPFLQNLKKLSNKYYFIMLINLIIIKIHLIFGKRLSIALKVFHFTDDFSKYFHDKYQSHTHIKVISQKIKVPSVLNWGVRSEISEVPYYKYFYIDEPLHITIGVAYRADIRAILKKIKNDEVLHVKLHPRTDKQKYKDFSKVVITESVPKKVKYLFGYKSNLLTYDFKYEKLFLFDDSLNLKDRTNVRPNSLSTVVSSDYQDVHDLRNKDLL